MELFNLQKRRLLSAVDYNGTLLNRYDTDSPLCVLRMASASIIEMSMTAILLLCLHLSSCGMVFVTTTFSKQALLMREIAGPEKIPWVRMA